MNQSSFEKIHHLNPRLNKILSPILFIAGILTTFLLLILPYRGRVLLALIINIFFNRPLVYLNYVAKLIAKPLHFLQVIIFYFGIFGFYAIFYQIFKSKQKRGWQTARQNTNQKNMEFQS